MRSQDRLTSLSFVDFLELLARVADALSPPSRQEVMALGLETGSMRQYLAARQAGTVPAIQRRASGDVDGEATRYLHDKLDRLIEVMVDALCRKYHVRSLQPLLLYDV